MGDEIETYILKKLDDAIAESKKTSEFYFAARLLLPKLDKEFTELRDLIVKKRAKIRSAAPAPPPPPPSNVKKISDASKPSATDRDSSILASTSAEKDSKLLLPAGGVKKSEAPRDDKETGALSGAAHKKESGAPSDAGDENLPGATWAGGSKKESDSDAADKKEMNAGDEKETGETDAPEIDDDDDDDDDDAGYKKETDAHSDDDNKESSAPSDDVDGGNKESNAPEIDEKESLATTSAKITSPDESKDSAPATASVTSGGDKKESDVGKTTSEDVSEISPATDAVTADKSITPTASAGDGEKESVASKTPTFDKSSSPDESEISPAAPDDKPKTPPSPTSAGGGKKESGVPPAHKSTTSDASTKSDPKPVNEEDLLREQLYYINNLLTEWQMITQKPFSYSSIKEFSNTLKKIKQDLKAETPKKDESSHDGTPPTASIDNASLTRTTPEVVEFRWSTRVNLREVHGFEDKILSLERLLVLRRKDTDTFKAFGIHGMAGVGKTTLCQSIFSRPKVTEYFFPRIWVCLSKQAGEDENNRKEVVKRMLRCLGIEDKIINKVDDKQSIRGLLFALRLQLSGKRYFIVLDDAHNPDEWFKMPDSDAENDNNKIYEKFSYGLPKECGGTVIVTSRVEQVVKNMVGEEENLRCIEPLTDQETCWNIFKDTVKEGNTPFPPDLEKLKAEIVKRCDGLPLAAKLLGQIKHKELRENPTAAINHQAAAQSGNHQAAGEAAK